MSRVPCTLPLLLLFACAPVVQTAPPPAGASAEQVKLAGAAVMIGVGDIASCGSRLAEATAVIVDSVLRADSIAEVEDAVFTLGDNAYTSGSAWQFETCFASSWGNPERRIMKKIRPAPGNHEYYTPRATGYYDYFGLAAGANGKGYYSYKVGTWHIVVLNSEMAVESVFSPADRKAQLDWLEKDLTDNPNNCTIAYWHHPRFSSGWHGSDRRMIPIWDILYEHKVDLVLAGHDHNYERFRKMNGAGGLDTARGIASIVAGTGGEDLRAMSVTIHPQSVARITGHAGVLLLTLGAAEYRSVFLDTQGRVWDASGGKCH